MALNTLADIVESIRQLTSYDIPVGLSATISAQTSDKVTEGLVAVFLCQSLLTGTMMTSRPKMEANSQDWDPLILTRTAVSFIDMHVHQLFGLLNTDQPLLAQRHLNKIFQLLMNVWVSHTSTSTTLEYLVQTGIHRNHLLLGFNSPLAQATSLSAIRAMMLGSAYLSNPISRAAPLMVYQKLIIEEASNPRAPLTLSFPHPTEILQLLHADDRQIYDPDTLRSTPFPLGTAFYPSAPPRSPTPSFGSMVTEPAEDNTVEADFAAASPPGVDLFQELLNDGLSVMEADSMPRDLETPDIFRVRLAVDDPPIQADEDALEQILNSIISDNMDPLVNAMRESNLGQIEE